MKHTRKKRVLKNEFKSYVLTIAFAFLVLVLIVLTVDMIRIQTVGKAYFGLNASRETPQPQFTCTDSDNGVDYSVKGNTVVYLSRVDLRKNETSTTLRENRTDTCEDSTTLNEQFCSSDSTASSISYDCPYGCADGVCTSQEVIQACGSSVPMNSSICKNVAQVYPIDPVSTPELKNIKLKYLDDSGYLRGKYVRVFLFCAIKAGTNQCIAPPGPPVYSPNHTFMFKPINYSAPGYFLPDYQGQHFDEVSLYYGFNLAAEWFDKTLGLKNAKRIRVDAYNPSISGDHAEAAYQDDGTPILRFPAKPAGFSAYRAIKVMFHEVTHMVFIETIKNNDYVFNNVMGATDLTAFFMNEGYALYFPCSYYNSSYFYSPNRPTDIDFDYNYSYGVPVYGEKSSDGWGILEMKEVVELKKPSASVQRANMLAFAGALWDVRKEIGPEVLDPMIVKSWRIMPVQKTGDFVVDAMVALVQADNKMYNGEHKQTIISAFAGHNIICKTCK